MRLVIQRVRSARVTDVGKGAVTGQIEKGLLVLWGISREDTPEDADYCVRKVLNVKLWEGTDGASWASSVVDNGFQLLLVSQFTLFGRLTKGNKPDFHGALTTVPASAAFRAIVGDVRAKYRADKVEIGSFGNLMAVDLTNDGPVTIVVDTADLQLKRKSKPYAELYAACPPPSTHTKNDHDTSAADEAVP